MGWTRLGLRLGPAAVRAAAATPAGLLAALAQVGEAAEDAGFDCLWIPAAPSGVTAGAGPDGASRLFPDPFVLAAALAQRTSSIRLGCLETPVTARSPSLLAKVAAGLDVLSRGRAAVGCDAGSASPAVVAEALEVVEAMLHREAPTMVGSHFAVTEAWNEPRLGDGPGPRLVLRVPAGRAGLDAGLVEAAGLRCDGCAVDTAVPGPEGLSARVRAAAGSAGRQVLLLGVVQAGQDGDPVADGAEAARRAVAAGCDAVVADFDNLPQAAELAAAAAGLDAVLS